MRTKILAMAVLLLPVGLVPAALEAQNTVVPASMARIEGGSGSSIPFGTNQPVRWQCIYDADELPWTGPRVINGISFRADNDVPGTTSFAGKQYLVVQLVMSTTTVRAETSSSRFDENLGEDATVVIANGRIALPAQPVTGNVRPENISFPFDQPWVFGTTPVRGSHSLAENLVIDLRIALQPAGAYRLDNPAFCLSRHSYFGNQGPMCTTSTGRQLTIDASTSVQAGGNLTFTVSQMPANAAFSVMMNLSSSGTLFGQLVPFPLFDPSNPSLPSPNLPFPHPAPGCWVNVAMVHSQLGVADNSGVGRIVVRIPAGRRFVGTSLYAQAVANDIGANPLLFTTSLGLQAPVCGPLGVARVYNVGDHQAQTGQRSLGQAAVFAVN